MMRRNRAGRGAPACQRGQALVEFAMVLPILLLLLILIFDIGFLTFQKNVLQASARDAARELAVGSPPSTAEREATRVLRTARIDPSGVNWSVTDQGGYITVQLTYSRPAMAPLLPLLVGGQASGRSLPLRAEATFRKRG